MITGFLVGNTWPELRLEFLIPLALFLMIFPAMLDTDLSKIHQAIRKPGLLIFSLCLNFLLSPVLILGLSYLSSLNTNRGMMAGAIVYGVIPCGGMVPAYTSMLNGNVNLAVCIMSVSLVLSIFIAPIWVHAILGQSIQVPYCLMAKFLAICIFIPMIAARLFRAYSKNMTYEKLERTLKNLSIFGLILMVFIVFVSQGKLIAGGPSLIIRVALVAFCFISILIGCSMAYIKVTRSSYDDSVALIISSTAKNTALAMGLASSYFGSEASLVVVIAGSIVQLMCMLVFLRIAKYIVDFK
jgi:arsenite transporter